MDLVPEIFVGEARSDLPDFVLNFFFFLPNFHELLLHLSMLSRVLKLLTHALEGLSEANLWFLVAANKHERPFVILPLQGFSHQVMRRIINECVLLQQVDVLNLGLLAATRLCYFPVLHIITQILAVV